MITAEMRCGKTHILRILTVQNLETVFKTSFPIISDIQERKTNGPNAISATRISPSVTWEPGNLQHQV